MKQSLITSQIKCHLLLCFYTGADSNFNTTTHTEQCCLIFQAAKTEFHNVLD